VINAIAERRLRHQSLTGPPRRTVEAVVSWLGAVQAQEYAAAKWGLGLRMPDGTTDAKIETAFNAGRILRTHVMRPTWHFVAQRDIRWMIELTGARVQKTMAVYNRQMELDPATLSRAVATIERALADASYLTRQELSEHLANAGIAAKGQRLAHITLDAELKGVICSGPRRDREFTYALVDERAPNARRLERDEALAMLAERFFKSHGPATIRDFVWWSGILTPEASRALEMVRTHRKVVDGETYFWKGDVGAHAGRRRHSAHLLPVYDEYLIAYRDRSQVPHRTSTVPSSFSHPFVIDGQVSGTWRPVRLAAGVRVEISPSRRLTSDDRRAIDEAAARYGHFLREPVTVATR
jgi:hypothetical protein